MLIISAVVEMAYQKGDEIFFDFGDYQGSFGKFIDYLKPPFALVEVSNKEVKLHRANFLSKETAEKLGIVEKIKALKLKPQPCIRTSKCL